MTWPTAPQQDRPAVAHRIPEGREAYDQVPGLPHQQGPGPELILRWNDMDDPGTVDVVVHFHGFSSHGAAMNIARHKEPASGLDYHDPRPPGTVGRQRPTLGLLPRGHFYGGRSGAGYDFPDLVRPGRLPELIRWSLERFGQRVGAAVPAVGRVILTAHSGGGAALWPLLAEINPHEVHVFDALYQRPDHLLRWARGRLQADAAFVQSGLEAHMRSDGGALRVLYTSGGGTAGNSLEVQRHLRQALAATPELARWYRVERAHTPHGEVPRRYGWQLLADAGAELIHS